MIIKNYSITTNNDLDALFRYFSDISNWPDIFPACRNIKIISNENDRVVFEITAKNKLGILKWTTESKIKRDTYEIHSKRLEGPKLLKYMYTYWLFKKTDNAQVKITMIRKFAVNQKSRFFRKSNERKVLAKYMEPVIKKDLEKLASLDAAGLKSNIKR
jgi:ribosome-associated toxin RatA of RatAB toxin-antitoxin module